MMSSRVWRVFSPFLSTTTHTHTHTFIHIGTTAITCLLRDSSIIISNVGDSRAISGKVKSDGTITAMPLSMDQTPLRRDEYLRVKAAGAEVLSVDQLDGLKDPSVQSWDEGSDDPPRCWLPNQEYPGSAFTRSIGDRVAGTIGVFAEPEILCKNLSEDDRFILLASDGIFEFMSSQEVAEIVHQHDLDDASGCQKACDQLVKRSYVSIRVQKHRYMIDSFTTSFTIRFDSFIKIQQND